MSLKCKRESMQNNRDAKRWRQTNNDPAHADFVHRFVNLLYKISPALDQNSTRYFISTGQAIQEETGIRDCCRAGHPTNLNVNINNMSKVNLALMTEQSLQSEHMCHATVTGSMTMDYATGCELHSAVSVPESLTNAFGVSTRCLLYTSPSPRD